MISLVQSVVVLTDHLVCTSNLNVNLGEIFLAGVVGVVWKVNIARVVNQINKR